MEYTHNPPQDTETHISLGAPTSPAENDVTNISISLPTGAVSISGSYDGGNGWSCTGFREIGN